MSEANEQAADAVERRLVDGSEPMTPQGLLAHLEGLGIAHDSHSHAAVFTVEEAQAVRAGPDGAAVPGAHIKNLFLRNKKGRMWLVTCLEDREVDLKALGQRLGGGRLSFGSPQRLMQYLGVTPGSVTPFAAINDRTGAISVMLDRAVLERRPVHAHPLSNDMTTSVEPEDLLRFLEACDHVPELIDFDRELPAEG